jgi:hypothetical protein
MINLLYKLWIGAETLALFGHLSQCLRTSWRVIQVHDCQGQLQAPFVHIIKRQKKKDLKCYVRSKILIYFIPCTYQSKYPSVQSLDLLPESKRNNYYWYLRFTSRSRWPRGLRSSAAWLLGSRFESRWRHGCLSVVFICCVVLCR